MGLIIKNGVEYSGSGGGGGGGTSYNFNEDDFSVDQNDVSLNNEKKIVELSKSEYDDLSNSEQYNGTAYFINDVDSFGLGEIIKNGTYYTGIIASGCTPKNTQVSADADSSGVASFNNVPLLARLDMAEATLYGAFAIELAITLNNDSNTRFVLPMQFCSRISRNINSPLEYTFSHESQNITNGIVAVSFGQQTIKIKGLPAYANCMVEPYVWFFRYIPEMPY